MKTFAVVNNGSRVQIADGKDFRLLDAKQIHALPQDEYEELIWLPGGYLLSQVMQDGGLSRQCPAFPQSDDAESERDVSSDGAGFGPVEPPAKKYRNADIRDQLLKFMEAYPDPDDPEVDAEVFAAVRDQILGLFCDWRERDCKKYSGVLFQRIKSGQPVDRDRLRTTLNTLTRHTRWSHVLQARYLDEGLGPQGERL
jgi:hypothetical protein